MAKHRVNEKPPSRKKYEQEHPTVSFRLDKETYKRLKEHLEATGHSFANFVKDALGREESMVERRVEKLASRKIEESKTPARDLELYEIVLDLARWGVVLWTNLPDPMEVPCPSCLFPSRLHKNPEPRTVTLEVLEDGNLKCPECGLTLKNPPQLAWVLLVSTVAEEVRREKFVRSQKREADDGGEVAHDEVT